MLAGVAGGMAEYFDVDPTIMRLIFVVILLAYIPLGLVAYIIASFIIPEKAVDKDARGADANNGTGEADDDARADRQEADIDQSGSTRSSRNTRYLFGAVLLIIGAVLMAKQIIPWFYTKLFWPVLLIAAGLFIMCGGWRRYHE